jgi:integrase
MNNAPKERDEQAPKILRTIARVKGREYTRFILDFGTVDGKRHRKSFSTEAEAQSEWKAHLIRQKRLGDTAKKLKTSEVHDAANAMEILGRAVTLTTAAEFWIKHNAPTGGKKTVAEAIAEFLAHRESVKNCRPATVRDYKCKLSLFLNEYPKLMVNHITVETVEKWLASKQFTPETRASYLRNMNAFCTWAARRKYAAFNPIAEIERPRLDRKTVDYLSPDEAERLLTTAQNQCPDILPYIAIGMFAGLRPAEMHGDRTAHPPLDWSAINFDKAEIDLAPEQTKTRDGRRVKMRPALLAWLLPHRQESGAIYYTRNAFETVIRESKINYTKDCLRHTAATYWWIDTKNEGEVAVQLGDTIKTVKRHYVNTRADAADAVKFWAIRPESAGAVLTLPKVSGE